MAKIWPVAQIQLVEAYHLTFSAVCGSQTIATCCTRHMELSGVHCTRHMGLELTGAIDQACGIQASRICLMWL